MTYKKREPRHDWRAKLTAEERQVINDLDRQRADIVQRSAEITAAIQPIRNRALQRVLYEADRSK